MYRFLHKLQTLVFMLFGRLYLICNHPFFQNSFNRRSRSPYFDMPQIPFRNTFYTFLYLGCIQSLVYRCWTPTYIPNRYTSCTFSFRSPSGAIFSNCVVKTASIAFFLIAFFPSWQNQNLFRLRYNSFRYALQLLPLNNFHRNYPAPCRLYSCMCG